MNHNLKISCLIAFLSLSLLSWQTPITLSGNGTNTLPAAAINDQGQAIVVWTNGQYPALSIEGSVFDGTAWSPYTRISNSPIALSAITSIDSAGNIVVAWEDISGTDRIIMAATKPFDGSWSTPVSLSNSSSNTSICISTNSSGQTIVGWLDMENNYILAATLEFGSSWSAPIMVSQYGGLRGNLKLKIDINGNGIMLWEDYGIGIIFVSQTAGGFNSPWSYASSLDYNGTQKYPSLSINAFGNAIAAWVDIQTSQIVTALYEDGNWLSSNVISNNAAASPTTSTFECEYFVSWVDLPTARVMGASTFERIWEEPFMLSANHPNIRPKSAYSNGILYTAWSDLLIGGINVADYLIEGSTPAPFLISSGSSQPPCIISEGSAQPPYIISQGSVQPSNVAPVISASSTNTIVAWQSIIGVNTYIQVNMN